MLEVLRLTWSLVLPLLACAALTIAAIRVTGRRRLGLVAATGVVGVFIAATTEALSVVDGIRPWPLVGCWTALAAVSALVAHRRRRDDRVAVLPDLAGWPLRALVGYGALMTMLLGLVAVLSPPNNFDSMAYHLPRVAQWAQNHTVGFFATGNARQLYMPPWAEYAVLHLHVMAGGDQWDNLVQLGAMVVTAAAISLVALQAGLSGTGQAVTAALVLAIPIGVAEAPTTQTDYVLTMWVACLLVVAGVDRVAAASAWRCAAFGGFLGLALLTKPTAWFFAAPVVLFFVWQQVRYRWRQPSAVLRDAAVVTVVVVALTGVFFARNVVTFGDPFGDETNVSTVASAPRALVENSVLSVAIQLGVPVDSVNRVTERATSGLLASAGLRAADATTTSPDRTFTVGFSTREDNAGSFAATLLGLAATVWLLARRPRHRQLLAVTAMAMLGFALRSVGQPFSPYLSRYLLTWFALLTPVTAAFLLALPRRLGGTVVALVCCSSLLWAVAADLRPLVSSQLLHASGSPSLLTQSRDDTYFAVQPQLRAPYQQAVSYVRALHPATVGVISGSNAFEYPLWALLQRGATAPRLQHVDAQFAPGRAATGDPQVVVCLEACPQAVAGLETRRDFPPLRVWSR